MKIAFFTLGSLIFLFAISLRMSLKEVSEDQINVKNGSRGLAFGLAILILLCLLMLIGSAQAYTGRCHQILWYDEIGDPCSHFEYFSRNADFAIGIGFLAGWPFILVFLGICVLVAYVWSKLPEKRET